MEIRTLPSSKVDKIRKETVVSDVNDEDVLPVEDASRAQRPRRAAAIDTDWCCRLNDLLVDDKADQRESVLAQSP